ncbi:hypothetical protein SELMODRAFT_429888 [Selaginella moellendorffii]|uniref:Uncharacterized protein n=1 Tax=Selaginella moellendorffii TaxID=88036 RepID=D8T7N2_SELML|nr:hypothetical protein SELMODRAFT_429888 [Selaginella moellendorffii]
MKMLKATLISLLAIVSCLSNAKNCQPDLLERLLQFLVHKGALSKKIDEKDGETYYGLTPISKGLAEEHHHLLLCTHALNGAEGHAYEIANKCRVWEHDPGHGDEYVKLLNDAMVAWSSVTISLVLEHYDGFKDVKKLVDGGLGMCMGKIVEKYPHIEGANFDLPHTVEIQPFPVLLQICLRVYQVLMLFFIKRRGLPEDAGELQQSSATRRQNDSGRPYVLQGRSWTYTDGGKTRRFEEHMVLLEKSGFGNVSLVNVPSKEQVIEAYKL